MYDYAGNVPVACGDTLHVLSRRFGCMNVQRLLERVALNEDNLPCAAAAPNSDLYNRIHHIFHFCRAPYNIAFRGYSFNIFKRNSFTLLFAPPIFIFSAISEDRCD